MAGARSQVSDCDEPVTEWKGLTMSQSDRRTNTFVSLKILSSEGTNNITEGKGDELEYVKRFIGFEEAENQSRPQWQQHIGRYFETFIHRTEEKVDHLCLTMEPLAWDFYVLLHRTPNERIPETTCKSLVRQILIALDGIHREMGCMCVGEWSRG